MGQSHGKPPGVCKMNVRTSDEVKVDDQGRNSLCENCQNSDKMADIKHS